MDPALHELARRGDPDDEVGVILRLRDPDRPPATVRIVNIFGDIATVRVRRRDIADLWADPATVSVKAPRLYTPDVEPPAAATEAADSAPFEDHSRPDLAETGRGVVVGMVDWGFDFAHPDFRRSDGRTRLLALWDQRPADPANPDPAASYGTGRLFTAAHIDAALAQPDPYRALGYHPADFDSGPGAHGTHTLSIAAGNGLAGGPPGMAPEADIVAVSMSRQPGNAMVSLGSSGDLLDACAMIFDIAGDRPCVINLSLGRHAGEHTGRLLLEQALDHLVSAAPGRAVVQSCGNYFQSRAHASWRLRPGEARTFRVAVDPADVTPNEVDIWYPGRDRLTVEVVTSDGAHRAVVPLGDNGVIGINGREVARIHHRAHDPNNGDHQISLFLDPDPAIDGWHITLHADDVVDGRVHAWIERDAGCRHCQAHFDDSDVDTTTTLGTIVNGLRTIAVGAYEAHRPDRPPGRFSSSGPTRDGRQKPDLVAPGVRVLGARSHPGTSERGPAYVRMSGTSMAAPAVTGTVALMFQAAGRPLPVEETRRALLASCDPPMPGADARRLGSGYLRADRAVAAVRPAGPAGGRADLRTYVDGDAVAAGTPGLDTWQTPYEASLHGEVDPCALSNLRVAVVGGGFAGLMAAWSLATGGAQVTVFEATERLGGRVRTDRSLVPGKVVEAGAELIGENHPAWIALARTFKLTLTKVTTKDEYKSKGLKVRLRFGMTTTDLTDAEQKQIESDLEPVLLRIGAEAKAIDALRPWTSKNAAKLDAMSLEDRLNEEDMFGEASSPARHYFEFFTENDQCVALDKQSYLGYLAAVKAHSMGGDMLAYWNRTETHRCEGGNDQLATALARTLKDVRLKSPVTAVEVQDSGVRVTYGSGASGGAVSTADFDFAILAGSPFAWPTVSGPTPFVPANYTIQHGPAVKFLSAFDRDFWTTQGLAPSALWDRLGSVWEGTDKQKKPRKGVDLSVYSGGSFVLSAPLYKTRMELLYPFYTTNLKKSSLVDWPNEPYVCTGYSVPAPKEVTTIAKNLSKPYQGRLFFAGEQASPGFFGYMEGALQSGLFASYEVAKAWLVACGGSAVTPKTVEQLAALIGEKPAQSEADMMGSGGLWDLRTPAPQRVAAHAYEAETAYEQDDDVPVSPPAPPVPPAPPTLNPTYLTVGSPQERPNATYAAEQSPGTAVLPKARPRFTPPAPPSPALAGPPVLRTCCMLSPGFLTGGSGAGGHGSGKPGIVYTGRAGFIDLAHLWDVCDGTAFAYQEIHRASGAAGTKIRTAEGEATLTGAVPPTEWMEVARSIAFDDALGHEIATYPMGAGSCGPTVPGLHNSSFSPEDLCSNFLGTVVAQRSILAGGAFVPEAERQLTALLASLAAQSATETRAAFALIARRWVDLTLGITNSCFLKRRNFTSVPFKTGHRSDAPTPGWVVKPFAFTATYDYQHVTGFRRTDFGTHIARIKAAARAQYGPDFASP
ncbi:FAD-dependent oxidoreductase [Streptomyces sp. NPDC001514]